MKKSLPFLLLIFASFNFQTGFCQESVEEITIHTLPEIPVIGYAVPLVEQDVCFQGICHAVSNNPLPTQSEYKPLIPKNRLLQLSSKLVDTQNPAVETTTILNEKPKILEIPNKSLYQGIVIDQEGNNLTGASVSLWKN